MTVVSSGYTFAAKYVYFLRQWASIALSKLSVICLGQNLWCVYIYIVDERIVCGAHSFVKHYWQTHTFGLIASLRPFFFFVFFFSSTLDSIPKAIRRYRGTHMTHVWSSWKRIKGLPGGRYCCVDVDSCFCCSSPLAEGCLEKFLWRYYAIFK